MSGVSDTVSSTWELHFDDHPAAPPEETCVETVADVRHNGLLLTENPPSTLKTPPSSHSPASSPSLPFPKGARGQPRKRPAPAPHSVPRVDYLAHLKVFPSCLPLEFPTNPSFSYVLTECDRNSPLVDSYLANPEEWHGPRARPLPGNFFRVFLEDRIKLSTQHHAPQLRISADRLTLTGDRGYAGVRANFGVSGGRFYYEFTVKNMPGNSAIRAGWGTHRAVLQAPLGYDKHGYSWRSRRGTIFHESKGKHYSSGYGVGDVLGCYIELPFGGVEDLLPNSYKNDCYPLVKYKNHFYYEVKDDTPKEVAVIKPNKGGKIMFFKNGVPCGIAFRDLYTGTYYPVISIYKNASVTVNFGPSFEHPPEDLNFLPLSERVVDGSVEQTMSDILYSIPDEPGPAAKKRKTKHGTCG